MRRRGFLGVLTGPVEALAIGGPWTAAVAATLGVQVAAFAGQVLLGTEFFHDLALAGSSEDGLEPWRFLTFLLVNHPDPLLAACQLGLNLLLFGMVAGEVGHLLGTRRFLLYYLLTALGSAAGGVLWSVNREVYGALGPAAAILVAFATLDPHRRIYGRIPARLFAAFLLALFLAGHIAIARFAARPIVDPGSLAAQSAGGILVAFAFFYLRPRLQRRQLVREMFRDLADMQERDFLRDKVDELLEKITRVTIAGLTRKERRFLSWASQRLQESQERESAERRERRKSENSFPL